MIRKAFANEAGIISELALSSKAHWGYSKDFMESCRAELSYSEAIMNSKKYHFYVKELDEQLAGFYALHELSRREIELQALFIKPQYIRKGLGRELFEHSINYAHTLGASSVIIQSDPFAEKFYQTLGAKITGEQESGSIPGRNLKILTVFLDRNEKFSNSAFAS